jgi:Ca2+-binding RTX toxin-like protein
MKKKLVTSLALLALVAAFPAHAETAPASTTVVLAGGSAQNTIRIWLTPDGYSYVIDSATPLEVGGTICKNAPENANELICEAPPIAGFVVNCGGHDDSVTVSRAVEVPVTFHGGTGRDTLRGGGGNDMIGGGPGNDVLVGRGGNDAIFGGAGNDLLRGGSGDDSLHGGPGRDRLRGGPGHNVLSQ